MIKTPSGFSIKKNLIPKETIADLLYYSISLFNNGHTVRQGESSRLILNDRMHFKSNFSKLEDLKLQFQPEDAYYNHCVINRYDKGYKLKPHSDGSFGWYKRVAIITLKGSANFFQIDKAKRLVKPGDVILMDGRALCVKHSLPALKEERISIVLRYTEYPPRIYNESNKNTS